MLAVPVNETSSDEHRGEETSSVVLLVAPGKKQNKTAVSLHRISTAHRTLPPSTDTTDAGAFNCQRQPRNWVPRNRSRWSPQRGSAYLYYLHLARCSHSCKPEGDDPSRVALVDPCSRLHFTAVRITRFRPSISQFKVVKKRRTRRSKQASKQASKQRNHWSTACLTNVCVHACLAGDRRLLG